MDDPERPGPDAEAAEIAEWMEEDFGRALAEGVENAGDGDMDGKSEQDHGEGD